MKRALIFAVLAISSAYAFALPAEDVAFDQAGEIIHVEQADINLAIDNPVEFGLTEFEFRRDFTAGHEQAQSFEKAFTELPRTELVSVPDAPFEVGWRVSL